LTKPKKKRIYFPFFRDAVINQQIYAQGKVGGNFLKYISNVYFLANCRMPNIKDHK